MKEYTLSQAHKETGIPLSTLQQAVGNYMIKTTLRPIGRDIRHMIAAPELEKFAAAYHADKDSIKTPIIPRSPSSLGKRGSIDDRKIAAARRKLEIRREAAALGINPEDIE